MQPAVPEQGAGELDEPEVVLGLFVVADQDGPAFLEPGEGALDDPAAGRMPPTLRATFTAMTKVGDVMSLADRRLDLGEVVALVEAQVLRVVDRRSRAPDNEAVQVVVAAFISWVLAAVTTTASGAPRWSVSVCRFVPSLPRSVGLGPVCAPPTVP